MLEHSGNNWSFDQGETPTLRWAITDEKEGAGDPVDLTGGTSKLVYTTPANLKVTVDCTIATTTVSYKFIHAISRAMNGNYPYELWCKNQAGDMVKSLIGVIRVNPSQDPDAVCEETHT